MEGECESERNTAGEMEGLSTKRYADGSVYESDVWKANHKGRPPVGGTNHIRGECTHSAQVLHLHL